MELGLAYTNEFDGLKSMTTYDTVPLTLYSDGLPFDLNVAKSVTLHVGSAKGYVGAMSLDIVTDKSLFGQGIISFPANKTFMQQLPPDIYYIEVWVNTDSGNLIFPSKGILPFTVDENLLNTSQNGVYSMTLYNFVNNLNELTNIIENKQAQFVHDNGDLINVVKNSKETFNSYSDNLLNSTKSTIQKFTNDKNEELNNKINTLNDNINRAQSSVGTLEDYKKGITDTARKVVFDYTDEGLNLIKKNFNTSGSRDISVMNHRFSDIRKAINHPELIKDTYNQTFHFSTPYGWLNDIQTIVRVNDHWNIYYLNNDIKNKEELASEWYVAQTTDFKTFSDAGVALHRMPNLWGDVFTGSIIKNRQEDGHVITDKAPSNGYLAFFCGHTPGMQQMYCAYSDDEALDFHPLDASLVLPRPSNADGFRDGKVLYNPKKKELVMYMVQGTGNDGTEIHTYTSPNGEEKTWRDTGILNLPSQRFTNESPGAYECPNIIEGIRDQSTNEVVDVLTVSGNTGSNGLGSFYIIGNLDENGIFQRKPNANFKRLDYGLDAYAGNFTDHLTDDGGVVNINWIGSWSRNYPDFMAKNNNYHMGSFSLPRKLKLNNGVLNNEIIEPVSDVLLHWYDTHEVSLHEKSSRAKITAKFNEKLNDNKFTLDYGDGVVEVYIQQNKIFIGQPSGIFPVPNGATCFTDSLIDELVFYVDNGSIEIYIPKEKKIITHLMLSNNKDIKFHSDVAVTDLKIRQFNSMSLYGSTKPVEPSGSSNNSNTINNSSGGSNEYYYRGKWNDPLYDLNKALPGYYSLEGNLTNGPKGFSGYGNVEVTHNDSDTFVTLKSEDNIWINQHTFGNWSKWKQITNDGKNFTYRGDWTDDMANLVNADTGIYAVPGVFTNIPKDFSGYGNVEVTHNDSDTFVTLKSVGDIWTNQFTEGKWIGWDKNVKDSNSLTYKGDWTDDLYALNSAKTGIYSLSRNKQNAPDDFSGYGNIEVTHNLSDTFVTLKSEGKIWTNQFTLGKWLDWEMLVKDSNSFSYHGDWKDTLALLTEAKPGYYSLSGNKQNAPDDFSGYGNIEVTHNLSDTFVTLKSEGKIWTNQFTLGKWLDWEMLVKDSNSFSFHGKWTKDLALLTKSMAGYYVLENNKQNAPDDFSGYGNIEVTHNDSDTFVMLKSEGKIWTNQFTFDKWIGWERISTNPILIDRGGLPSKDLNKILTSGIYHSFYGGMDNVPIEVQNTATMIRLEVIQDSPYVIQKLYPLGGWHSPAKEIPMFIRNYVDNAWSDWKPSVNIEKNEDVVEIDNAFSIKEPGTYTHPYGKHMQNVPPKADELNDYTIIATGWKKTNTNGKFTRKWVRKLVLVDSEGNEYYSTYNNITDKFSRWKQHNEETIKNLNLPSLDLNKVTEPGTYSSPYGGLINAPKQVANTFATVRLEVYKDGPYNIQKLYPLGGADSPSKEIQMFIRNNVDNAWSDWTALSPVNPETVRRGNIPSNNLDDIKTSGIYSCPYGGLINAPKQVANTFATVRLEVYKDGPYNIQKLYPLGGADSPSKEIQMFIRNNVDNAWSDWTALSPVNPETVRRGNIPSNNLDDIKTSGIYSSPYGNMSGIPNDLVNTATKIRLEVIKEEDYVIQKLYPLGGWHSPASKVPMYIRNYVDGVWSGWKAGISF